MSWQAMRWAMTAPFPKSDPTGRLVLAYLAEKADKDGRNAYPMAISIAYDLDLNPDVVPRVLKRLCGYGLLTRAGKGPQGQPNWSLHLDRQSRAISLEEFCERHRSMRSARQSRWRDNGAGDDPGSSTSVSHRGAVDALESSTADDPQSSTPNHVDDSESSRRRSSIVSKTTLDRLVDDSKYPQNRPYNHPNRPYNRPADPADRQARAEPTNGLALDLPDKPSEELSKPAKAKPPSDYTEAFEEFWSAYGRKGAKKAAATEWHKAITRADPAVIMAGVDPYVASTPEFRYRKDAERWLKNDGWESVPVSPTTTSPGGYTPYRDPIDPSVYEEGL